MTVTGLHVRKHVQPSYKEGGTAEDFALSMSNHGKGFLRAGREYYPSAGFWQILHCVKVMFHGHLRRTTAQEQK